ncbi:hypothetical protein U2P60_04075 [Brucella sp. H1_1004]|uniref:hypothetical protein n=1 Tax=Brucella sp. H1_1004 TaxID=3110109 RepID=UPI0039B53074
MKRVFFLFLGVISLPAIAHADKSDDYVACLVGKAATVLHKQKRPDTEKALAEAYKRCKEPKGLPENELEGISDYVNMQVEAMAAKR